VARPRARMVLNFMVVRVEFGSESESGSESDGAGDC
jgi:hypothetical protein